MVTLLDGAVDDIGLNTLRMGGGYLPNPGMMRMPMYPRFGVGMMRPGLAADTFGDLARYEQKRKSNFAMGILTGAGALGLLVMCRKVGKLFRRR